MQQLFCLFTQRTSAHRMVSCDREPSWISFLVRGTYQFVTLTCYQLASFRCQLKWNKKHHFSLEGDIISEVILLWIWVTVTIFSSYIFIFFFLHFGWSWKWILWPYIQWNWLALIMFFFVQHSFPQMFLALICFCRVVISLYFPTYLIEENE